MALTEFKKELDFLNEHHLHDILHELYNSERYYIGDDENMTVEGYEPIPMGDATIEDNFITSIEYYQFMIQRLKFSSDSIELKNYRIINLPYKNGISHHHINKNLLYLTYEYKTLIIDIGTGNSWEISIFIGDYVRNIITYKDLLIIVKTDKIYVINKDGTYNILHFKLLVRKSFMEDSITKVEVANNNLYVLSLHNKNITIINLSNFSSKIIKPDFESLNTFYIANKGNSTVLCYDKKIEIYSPIRSTLKCENFIPSDDVYKSTGWKYDPEDKSYIIEINMNKNKTKLIVAMSYDSDNAHRCVVIYNLISGKIEQVKYLEERYDASNNVVGFLDIDVNQSLGEMGEDDKLIINLKNTVKIEGKLLKTYEY
jgi:hypothetical protein